MQTLSILIAPAFFAASIYMILGRLIVLVDGESHSPIRVKWLTKIFVGGDVLSFLAQSAGTYFCSLITSTINYLDNSLTQHQAVVCSAKQRNNPMST